MLGRADEHKHLQELASVLTNPQEPARAPNAPMVLKSFHAFSRILNILQSQVHSRVLKGSRGFNGSHVLCYSQDCPCLWAYGQSSETRQSDRGPTHSRIRHYLELDIESTLIFRQPFIIESLHQRCSHSDFQNAMLINPLFDEAHTSEYFRILFHTLPYFLILYHSFPGTPGAAGEGPDGCKDGESSC